MAYSTGTPLSFFSCLFHVELPLSVSCGLRFSACFGDDYMKIGTICYIYLHSNAGPFAEGFDKCLAIGAVFGGYFDLATHDTICNWVKNHAMKYYFWVSLQGKSYADGLYLTMDSGDCNTIPPTANMNHSDGIWNYHAWEDNFDFGEKRKVNPSKLMVSADSWFTRKQ